MEEKVDALLKRQEKMKQHLQVLLPGSKAYRALELDIYLLSDVIVQLMFPEEE